MGSESGITGIETPAVVRGDEWVVSTARRASLLRCGGVLGCCALTALAAQVRIPVPGTDVPMTLQLLAVLLTGLMLPVAESVVGMALYLGLGVIGLPVFAPGSLGVFGPTGGYLAGFVPAAGLTAWIARREATGLWRLLAAGSVGVATVLAAGAMWRVFWMGGDAGLAVATGLLPFLPKAVVELFLAVAIVRTAGAYLKRR